MIIIDDELSLSYMINQVLNRFKVPFDGMGSEQVHKEDYPAQGDQQQ